MEYLRIRLREPIGLRQDIKRACELIHKEVTHAACRAPMAIHPLLLDLTCSLPQGVITMRLWLAVVFALILVSAGSAYEMKAYRFRDDYGMEPLQEYDSALSYYYYIPCPTYSWFWGINGLEAEEIIGVTYDLAQHSMGGLDPPDPVNDHRLMGFRVLNLAEAGSMYPGLFAVQFDVWCAQSRSCYNPIEEAHLWSSGPICLQEGYNYIWIEPNGVSICPCCLDLGPPPTDPLITITATKLGGNPSRPVWGFDDISHPVNMGCDLHDYGCLPALYPRPWVSHYPSIHSGYFGSYHWQYCPPLLFPDPMDTTLDYSDFGFIELAWRAYFKSTGPTSTDGVTWSEIKSLYR